MRQRWRGWMVVMMVLGLQGTGGTSDIVPRCTVTRVVDTHTPIPGGTGPFERLALLEVDSSTVLFQGWGGEGQVGLYTVQGSTLQVVADTHTPIPGGTATFTAFFESRLHGTTVAFSGQ